MNTDTAQDPGHALPDDAPGKIAATLRRIAKLEQMPASQQRDAALADQRSRLAYYEALLPIDPATSQRAKDIVTDFAKSHPNQPMAYADWERELMKQLELGASCRRSLKQIWEQLRRNGSYRDITAPIETPAAKTMTATPTPETSNPSPPPIEPRIIPPDRNTLFQGKIALRWAALGAAFLVAMLLCVLNVREFNYQSPHGNHLSLGVVGVAIFGGLCLGLVACGRIAHMSSQLSDANRCREDLRTAQAELSVLKRKMEEAEYESKRRIEQQGKQIFEAKAECDRVRRDCEETVRKKKLEACLLLKEASIGFPWLARAIAKYETLQDFQRAEHLETKPHPAHTAAEHVHEVAARNRQFRLEYHIARSRLEYYETLFPWLGEYVGLDLDTLIGMLRKPEAAEETDDPVRRYLPPGQYEGLSPRERNQLALDRYQSRQKSPWELGREFERFIGYRYEKEGWEVDYYGISQGLSDMGRDLIVRKGREVRIVQCKYWSQHKAIHEKHIAQLFGTTVMYRIEHPELQKENIHGVFITSTKFSPMAKEFAKELGIIIEENVGLEPYPVIKCNIGHDESGSNTKIYHLPMDQQYDKTKIVKPGECCVATVAEAERLGFRRAWRWHAETHD